MIILLEFNQDTEVWYKIKTFRKGSLWKVKMILRKCLNCCKEKRTGCLSQKPHWKQGKFLSHYHQLERLTRVWARKAIWLITHPGAVTRTPKWKRSFTILKLPWRVKEVGYTIIRSIQELAVMCLCPSTHRNRNCKSIHVSSTCRAN